MRLFFSIFRRLLVVSLVFGAASPALADDAPSFLITVKDHAFTPGEVQIPAGQKVKLTIKNEDDQAMEFESFELNREKIIKGKGEASVYVGPLDAGSYPFFDDFHRDTAKGKLTAK